MPENSVKETSEVTATQYLINVLQRTRTSSTCIKPNAIKSMTLPTSRDKYAQPVQIDTHTQTDLDKIVYFFIFDTMFLYCASPSDRQSDTASYRLCSWWKQKGILFSVFFWPPNI